MTISAKIIFLPSKGHCKDRPWIFPDFSVNSCGRDSAPPKKTPVHGVRIKVCTIYIYNNLLLICQIKKKIITIKFNAIMKKKKNLPLGKFSSWPQRGKPPPLPLPSPPVEKKQESSDVSLSMASAVSSSYHGNGGDTLARRAWRVLKFSSASTATGSLRRILVRGYSGQLNAIYTQYIRVLVPVHVPISSGCTVAAITL